MSLFSAVWLLFSGETIYKEDSAVDNASKVAQHFPILNYILNGIYFAKSEENFTLLKISIPFPWRNIFENFSGE